MGVHTGRERLLKLLGLIGVLEDEGVEVSRAADLELDLAGGGNALDLDNRLLYNSSIIAIR